jgi:hypothetical protein
MLVLYEYMWNIEDARRPDHPKVWELIYTCIPPY